MRWPIISWLVVAVVGLLLGFAGVGPAVFADGAWPERYVVVIVIAVGYGLAGLLAGYLGGSWRPSVLLILPGILVGLLLGERQLWVTLFLVLITILTIVAGYGGAVLRAQRGT